MLRLYTCTRLHPLASETFTPSSVRSSEVKVVFAAEQCPEGFIIFLKADEEGPAVASTTLEPSSLG